MVVSGKARSSRQGGTHWRRSDERAHARGRRGAGYVAASDALAGIPPNRLSWGKLTAQEFLTVIDDVTTGSLTHFEPVFAWSGAEDLTVVEEQEGYGIVGRGRRQGGPADHSPNGNRSLREVTQPRVRGAALWATHALLASCHGDASDRLSGPIPQERQIARIRRSARASHVGIDTNC
jgi:hypothetical protein